jgi:cell division protein FtsL
MKKTSGLKKMKHTHTIIPACLLAVTIPLFLAVDGVQASRYANLETEVKQLEASHNELVEGNRRLIAEISLLSSADRIEKIAVDQLAMHRASSAEIVRIEMKGTK